jgi:RNA polymerase sigma-70 factor (ECF subfamily)
MNPEAESDVERLVQEARRGSEGAFDRLVRLHQARVRMFLSRFLQNDTVVDDLAQETFLHAYRGLPSYRGEARFSTWLLGIARNEILMHLREEARRRTALAGTLESSLAGWLAGRLESSPEPEPADERRLAALRACLGVLPERSAEILDKFYFQGRPGVEIAGEVQKRQGAFWVMLVRIRQTLRQCIERRLAAPEAQP